MSWYNEPPPRIPHVAVPPILSAPPNSFAVPPPNFHQPPPPSAVQCLSVAGSFHKPPPRMGPQFSMAVPPPQFYPHMLPPRMPPPPSHYSVPPPPITSSRISRESGKNTSIRSRAHSRDRSCSEPPGSFSSRSVSNKDRPRPQDGRRSARRDREETERDILLNKWRSNFCETSDDIARKLSELGDGGSSAKTSYVRSSPADLYYKRVNGAEVEATSRLEGLCTMFEDMLDAQKETIKNLPEYTPPPRKRRSRVCRHKSEKCSSSESSDDEIDCSMEELSRKLQHQNRLHPDLWHNESGEMNDGPLCRCSAKSRRTGIRHGIYPGELGHPKCVPNTNNADRLYHYRITISPPTNFLTKTPTIIKYDQHEFLFEGFSLLSHVPIAELPTCKVIRFNIEYTITYVEEKLPENFTIHELDLFFQYIFIDLLELLDFTVTPQIEDKNICSSFHFMPRFVRDLPDDGKEVLAMNEVLKYLLESSGPIVDKATLTSLNELSTSDWQDYVDFIKGMVVTKPGMKPCSIRVDQLDRDVSDLPNFSKPDEDGLVHPIIVHFGIRPPQLSYAGNPEYQKAWRDYVKARHLVANMSKPSYEEKRKLEAKESKLQEIRAQGRMKRNVTVEISSKGFLRTGIMCDMVQHAMLIPVLTSHLRFHQCLDRLESNISYKFQNRFLLQLALTHPSYKENFGTNPDHARNSLTNCGIRQPEYGDRKIHYMNTRKRGINTLINIMSRFGKEIETDSNISHNERLEFLGDAVVEFLSSIHLFLMFPELEEGGLATYRAAIVQNQHLALLAKGLRLDEFMLYAHGSDLCHALELRHAMANCFEALMGALLLDGGINVADKVFAYAFFMDNDRMRNVWENLSRHPLQEQEPLGDRQWIETYPLLKHLTEFEDSIGVKFRHIRLLARAFTDRSKGYTHLTLGSNQRLEFLGDTVLQLICSEYLYRHFPEHHEGHLSLLRSSLVNNRTQAVVCDDLGMAHYAVYSNPKADLKTKDRADLLEAFLGALYIDKGFLHCQAFCQVCLFPRLQDFIMNQDWNDPKSKLQQCCLTLRTMDGGEPDIPVYKVIQTIGPTNTRLYTVAVYFRGRRLASATGHSIQQSEMNAAKEALDNSKHLFPQLDHQKRVISQSIKRQHGGDVDGDREGNASRRDGGGHRVDDFSDDDSRLPKQYRTHEDISSDEMDVSDFEVEAEPKSPRMKSKRSKSGKRRRETIKSEFTSDEDDGSLSDIELNTSKDDQRSIKSLNESLKPISSSSSSQYDECISSEEKSDKILEVMKKMEELDKKQKMAKPADWHGSSLTMELEDISSDQSIESGEID